MLGPSRAAGAPHILTEQDAQTGALFARNPWNHAFPGVAFADLRGAQTEFDLRPRASSSAATERSTRRRRWYPAAPLSGRSGAGLDPCAALRTRFELEPGATTEIVFLLGQAADDDAARAADRRYCAAPTSTRCSAQVREHWEELPATCRSRRRTAPSTS